MLALLMCLLSYLFPSSAALALVSTAQINNGQSGGKPSLVQEVQWDVSSGKLVCTVKKEQASLNQTLRCSPLKSSVGDANSFEFRTQDSLLAMYPLGEYDARLITVWTGGSSYHLRIMASIGGNVTQVMKASTRGMPEVVINGEEKESIIVTHMTNTLGRWRRSNMATADIYSWNGRKYIERKGIPWAERLTVASKQ